MQPNIDTTFAPLPESSSVSLSVASPSAGRFCYCGASIDHRAKKAKYCSDRCAKKEEKRKESVKRAVYVAYICPYCGKTGTRRKTCGSKVVTCGEEVCVKAHKIHCKRRLNKAYAESGVYKTWPSAKKNYQKPKQLNECICGRKKLTTQSTCSDCRSFISEAKRLTKQYMTGDYGMSACSYCGTEFQRAAKHQVYCSTKCQRKRKIDRYRRNGTLSERMRKYRKLAEINDPLYKLKRSVRTRLREGLRGYKKADKTFSLLGYTPEQLREHLERRFIFGMGWHNYGSEWHIDHIKPVSMHTFRSANDVYKCWRLDNLQPRYATNLVASRYGSFQEGNIEKGNRYVG